MPHERRWQESSYECVMSNFLNPCRNHFHLIFQMFRDMNTMVKLEDNMNFVNQRKRKIQTWEIFQIVWTFFRAYLHSWKNLTIIPYILSFELLPIWSRWCREKYGSTVSGLVPYLLYLCSAKCNDVVQSELVRKILQYDEDHFTIF